MTDPRLKAFEDALRGLVDAAYSDGMAGEHEHSPSLAAARSEIFRLYEEAVKERDALRKFVEWAMESPWQGCDLDGGDVQDKALALGFIVEVPADDDFREEYDADTMYAVAWSDAARATEQEGE